MAEPGLAEFGDLRQRYAAAAAEFAARVAKLSEAAGSIETDAFATLWERCDEARQLCVALNQQIRGRRSIRSKELTNRETEVLRLVAEGFPNKEIAIQLGISVKTVEFHKHSLYERLSVGGTAELVRYAIRTGLVTP